MARKMGETEIADRFEKRSLNWRNSFDAKTGFLRARKSDGSFRTPFDPTAINYGSDYTEGNAWQYSWFMPHDEGGLIRELGGDYADRKRVVSGTGVAVRLGFGGPRILKNKKK